MAWLLLGCKNLRLPQNRNPNPNLCTASAAVAAAMLAPFLGCKQRKKLKKKQQSPRVSPIQSEEILRLPRLESILDRDAAFRLLSRTKSFLSRRPDRRLTLSDAGKLHRDLGLPRGRKPSRSLSRHPLLLKISSTDLGFTPLMDSLLVEEQSIMNSLEPQRIAAVRKLLMISNNHRIPLAKLHHCRSIFGLPDDFRDRIRNYPEFFRVAIDPADGRHVLELAAWDPALAVSALERDFVPDEHRVRSTFKFPIPHRRSLPLDEDEEREIDSLSTLPLISPYSDGSGLRPWTVEAEKYRVGVVHELLSLTIEKRASIHHIVEFKEEFGLTRHTYRMLVKQPRAFYLAGTKMNWAVFLRDAYREDGSLIEKDPQVVFEEKLQRYAAMSEKEARELVKKGLEDEIVGKF